MAAAKGVYEEYRLSVYCIGQAKNLGYLVVYHSIVKLQLIQARKKPRVSCSCALTTQILLLDKLAVLSFLL